jgi:hypothetical protein
MRICLIGNSHLACFKYGWNEVERRYPDVHATFFGAPGDRARHLVVRDGRLVAGTDPLREGLLLTSGGESAIDPEKYDAFVLVGWVTIQAAMDLARQYTPHTFPETVHGKQIVSEALFRAALAAEYSGTVVATVARRLRQLTTKRILLAPQPMPSRRAMEERERRFRTTLIAGRQVFGLACAAADLAFADLAEVVWQPVETIADHAFTRTEFSEGSKRLLKEEAHPDDDFSHMNAAFGTLALSNILASLDQRVRLESEVVLT